MKLEEALRRVERGTRTGYVEIDEPWTFETAFSVWQPKTRKVIVLPGKVQYSLLVKYAKTARALQAVKDESLAA